jgi:alpha-ribazole phosphatase/probable phosphoglycerate mutase
VPVSVVYETHSVSTDNEAGFASGWNHSQLSERGRELAQVLGARRRNDGIDVVFSSDLRRAVETAEIAFEGTATPLRQDERLRECNYGELNGAPVARVHAERSSRIDVPFPGGESYRDVVERTRDFLHDLARHYDGKRVLIISHSANLWALQHLLEDRPLEEAVAGFAWREGWEFGLPAGWSG